MGTQLTFLQLFLLGVCWAEQIIDIISIMSIIVSIIGVISIISIILLLVTDAASSVAQQLG